jgi:hypothetical protein
MSRPGLDGIVQPGPGVDAAAHLAAIGHEWAAIGYDVDEDLSIRSGPVG